MTDQQIQEELKDKAACMDMSSEKMQYIINDIGFELNEILHSKTSMDKSGEIDSNIVERKMYEYIQLMYKQSNEIYFAAMLFGRLQYDEVLSELMHMKYHMKKGNQHKHN